MRTHSMNELIIKILEGGRDLSLDFNLDGKLGMGDVIALILLMHGR